MNKCKDCRWYEGNNDNDGDCFRKPPVVVVVGGSVMSVVPETRCDSTCMHQEPRNLFDNASTTLAE